MPRVVKVSTEQIEKFVSTYRLTFSLKKAATAAGHLHPDAGGAIMRRPDVQALLEEKAEQDVAAADLKVSTVLRHIKELSEVSIDDVMEEVAQPKGRIKYRIKPLDAMTPAAKRAIASMKVVRKNLETGDGYVDEVIEVKFWPKTQALELLARHLGLLRDTIDIHVSAQAASAMSDDEALDAFERELGVFRQQVMARRLSRVPVYELPPAEEEPV